MPRIPTLHVVITAALVPMSPAKAQTVISDRITCAECRILDLEVAKLGEAEGRGAIAGPPIGVTEDSQGRFWLLYDKTAPLVFDHSGRFLREIGTVGAGPAEFRGPYHAFVIPGDSLVVLDQANQRATVVGPNLTPARTITLSGWFMTAVSVTWPDAVLISGKVPSSMAASQPVHIVSFAEGQTRAVTSFGASADEPLDGNPWSPFRHLIPAGEKSTWVVHPYHYRLRRLSNDGTVAEVLDRTAAWFKGYPEFSMGSPTIPPPTTIRGMSIDATGRLWLFIHTPSQNWRTAWPALPSGTREVSANAIKAQSLYRTAIEVLDPVGGKLIARRQIDAWVAAVLQEGRVALYQENALGFPSLKIVQFVMEAPNGAENERKGVSHAGAPIR